MYPLFLSCGFAATQVPFLTDLIYITILLSLWFTKVCLLHLSLTLAIENPQQQKGTSLVSHMVKNLPAMQEIQVWLLCQKGPLEKRMVTHSSILAWKIPWSEDSMDREFHGQRSTVHSISKNWTRLSKWLTLSLSIRERISVLSLMQTSRE